MERKLSVNLGNVLLSLSELAGISNPNLYQHQLRTAFIALEIAKEKRLQAEAVEEIFAASLLHDVGAISLEEKYLLQNFEVDNVELHCIRGELLLKEVPALDKLSGIVRNHHKEWRDWQEPIDNPLVLSSQIICLADYVERLVDRSAYILHQNNHILEKISSLKGTIFNEEVLECFMKVGKKEAFWLDLVSPRLYPTLLHTGPYKNREIDLEGLSSIGKLFRHIIDFKSSFTATHTAGVAACSEILARLFGLSELEIKMIEIAGDFHDLGKLSIPTSILEKPGKLSKEETAIIKSHTYYTYQVLNSIGGVERIRDWAAFHHEKLNGSGYPFHFRAEEIDIGARIIAVSDIFVALVEDRPYRKGMEKEKIYKILKNQGDNNLIDIKIVDLLFNNYESVNSCVLTEQTKAAKIYKEIFLDLTE